MSLLNVNLSILAYSDATATLQPNVRLADLKWSLLGLPSDNFKNVPISLAPGETLTVASTSRTLSYSGATSFVVTKQGADRMRISASFGQRLSRNSGDNTTVWDLTKNGQVVRLTASANTAPGFAGIQIGDSVNLTAFNSYNNGEYVILSKGTNYIEFVNAYAQNQAGVTTSPLSIYSSGPVQKGDILDITSPQFAFPNQGAFPVLAVTDQYIEVLNPNAFNQTVTGITTGFDVYPYAYKWMMIAVDRKVVVGLNGSGPSSIEVEPPVEGDLIKTPGLFLKRGKVFQVQIMNTGAVQALGFLLLAE